MRTILEKFKNNEVYILINNEKEFYRLKQYLMKKDKKFVGMLDYPLEFEDTKFYLGMSTESTYTVLEFNSFTKISKERIVTVDDFIDRDRSIVKNNKKVCLKIGDICFLNNDMQIIITTHSLLHNFQDILNGYHDTFSNTNILKVERPINYETIYTCDDVSHVLDKIEKEYLLNFIKPFRNRVVSISKWQVNNKKKICIKLDNEKIMLPKFSRDMYRGMEPFKNYSLEELGL